ncbi:class I SAM-dependent methyltransferase [Allomesorhizobium alhagi]|uniref:Putative 3-demethylubiquinone-9 3-methyltransferase n=1 Tax=Mesorhizobium alhagi CCNWXJ12-2 TaxID=1107882 RepID=H0HUI5_9HYPH|nr:class I SAM-dependent methyltransferase [Mesorhizobium alhagi]EHK55632.1 putative 3-demethylubiquinone-9 3-methyltransferase [Mesorhizobium alhagi CCNWXJ12-2]
MNKVDPISLQRRFWNRWNAEHREHEIQDVCIRQAEVVLDWLNSLGRNDLNILEVGCGSGWLCPRLLPFGRVTGTDLSDDVLARVRQRVPEVTFVSGDFMKLDLGSSPFDVVITLEVLSHVADQPSFVRKLASYLRPGGHLMLATQNRFVLERFNRISPPAPGQLRRWVSRHELRRLLTPEFEVLELFSVSPKANRGFMRLVNSEKLNRPLKAIFGDRIERLKEAMGLGWTLMALARRRH